MTNGKVEAFVFENQSVHPMDAEFKCEANSVWPTILSLSKLMWAYGMKSNYKWNLPSPTNYEQLSYSVKVFFLNKEKTHSNWSVTLFGDRCEKKKPNQLPC